MTRECFPFFAFTNGSTKAFAALYNFNFLLAFLSFEAIAQSGENKEKINKSITKQISRRLVNIISTKKS